MTLTALLILGSLACVCYGDQPNIVFLMADDLGWNDVGWNNRDIISPKLNSLARTGIILDYNYVQPVCSPSRAAMLSGIYPFKLGLQHLVIQSYQAVCLPTDLKLLPQVLKDNGYATHMLGKWHLGFCSWDCTPTEKGFDTFFGYYNGGEDYNTKEIEGAFDFRDNRDVYRAGSTNYSTYQYADRAESIIRNHDSNKPLYMYMAFQNVHEPLQVPEIYKEKYRNIKDANRRDISAMVTVMDDAIGRIVDALKVKGLYDNTLLIFSSDNGGGPSSGGNNWPLRGGKATIFEGGTRVPGFVHGKMLNRGTGHFTGLMHLVDWFPTLLQAAGISYTDDKHDGMSQWPAINSRPEAPKRNEIIYNLDYHPQPITGQAGIRIGDYKLIEGYPGPYQKWYKPNYGQYLPTLAWPPFQYLFNLKEDPEERNNIYKENPEIVARLKARLAAVKADGYIDPKYPEDDGKSDPKKFGGAWSPGWC